MAEPWELSDEDLKRERDRLREAHWEAWTEYRRAMSSGLFRFLPDGEVRELLGRLDEVRELRRRWQEAEQEMKRRKITGRWWWPF